MTHDRVTLPSLKSMILPVGRVNLLYVMTHDRVTLPESKRQDTAC